MARRLDEMYEIYITKEVLLSAVDFAYQFYPREFFANLGGKVKKGKLIINQLYFEPFRSDPGRVEVKTPYFSHTTNFVGTIHSYISEIAQASEQDRKVFGLHLINFIMAVSPSKMKDLVAYDQEGNKVEFKIITHRRS